MLAFKCLLIIATLLLVNTKGSSNGYGYSFDKIYQILSDGIKCLSKEQVLPRLPTFYLTSVAGILWTIQYTTPNLPKNRKKQIDNIIERIDPFIRAYWTTYPNDTIPGYPDISTLGHYRRFYALNKYKYVFKDGNIPKNIGTENKTIEDYINEYRNNLLFFTCANQLYSDNLPHEGWRDCVLTPECQDYFNSITLGIVFQVQNNCSLLRCNIKKFTSKTCVDDMKAVNIFLKKENNQIFKNNLLFFSYKVNSCAKLGYAEFMSKEINNVFIKSFGSDGCSAFGENWKERLENTAFFLEHLALLLKAIAEDNYD